MEQTFRIGELAVIFCVAMGIRFFLRLYDKEGYEFTNESVFDTFCKALLIASLCKIYLSL